jgi:hypothetical protein
MKTAHLDASAALKRSYRVSIPADRSPIYADCRAPLAERVCSPVTEAVIRFNQKHLTL